MRAGSLVVLEVTFIEAHKYCPGTEIDSSGLISLAYIGLSQLPGRQNSSGLKREDQVFVQRETADPLPVKIVRQKELRASWLRALYTAVSDVL